MEISANQMLWVNVLSVKSSEWELLQLPVHCWAACNVAWMFSNLAYSSMWHQLQHHAGHLQHLDLYNTRGEQSFAPVCLCDLLIWTGHQGNFDDSSISIARQLYCCRSWPSCPILNVPCRCQMHNVFCLGPFILQTYRPLQLFSVCSECSCMVLN